MITLQYGIASFDFETGTYRLLIDPVNDPAIRFNDGKCDPQYVNGLFEIPLN